MKILIVQMGEVRGSNLAKAKTNEAMMRRRFHCPSSSSSSSSSSASASSAPASGPSPAVVAAAATASAAGIRSPVTLYSSLLQHSSDGSETRRIHHNLIVDFLDQDVFVCNHLIQTYGRHGLLHESSSVFHGLERRNAHSWTSMAMACALLRCQDASAFQILEDMLSQGMLPVHHTFSAIVGSCDCQERGKRLHVYILNSGLEGNAYVGSSLVDMYGKCGCLKSSQRAFDLIEIKDSVSWTSLIAIYASIESRKAIDLYLKMDGDGIRPNEVTFSLILVACANLQDSTLARAIHTEVYRNGLDSVLIIANALLNFYGKCGCLEEAKWIFDGQTRRDTVSWNSIVLAHTLHGKCTEAIELFIQMGGEAEPNDVTFINVLGVCDELIVPIQGKIVHAWTVYLDFHLYPAVSTALVSMYGKCGCMNDANDVFYNTCVRDVVSWTSLIEAYASHGYVRIVIDLLFKMQCEGVKPDKVTYMIVLSSCSHAGWVDEAYRQFKLMMEDHGIPHTIEHYGCMIDLYSRIGQLEEAEKIMFGMPFFPNDVTWEIFLGACQIHHDSERGKWAGEEMIQITPGNSRPYVLLSNIYVS